MKLLLHPLTAEDPPVRPAETRRDWMDETPESFAYRCLPLAAACQHGWEVFAPTGVTARWNGGDRVEDVEVELDDPMAMNKPGAAMTNFGAGILTFEMGFLLRTPPGWNIWVTGPTNQPKDGIFGLSGVIETDWSPYSFTMNWRFTRPGEVRFEPGEAVAHFFPVRRDLFDRVTPEIRPLHADPKTYEQMQIWRESRSDFSGRLKSGDEEAAEEKWQKGYYRGLMPDGKKGPADHKIKIRVPAFKPGEAKGKKKR
ncbi:hypothetical protein DDZ18_00705 [Marinicauda salina]|uniref:Uncharacterized protein n=1 Tax=Marinicauda salina TaxID=2135793 RepID=A0A2U2BY48_9PROT|nr:DUF6065 family protein [Marinicauda salina]PWE18909.1 hypothetical protein DDZ18_00705 [Marinicauda salina]